MSAKSGADSRAVLASGGESACAKARRHQANSIVRLFAWGAASWLRCDGTSGSSARAASSAAQRGSMLFEEKHFAVTLMEAAAGICVACSAWNQRIRQTAKRRCGLGELLVCCDQAGAVLEGQNQVSGVVDTQRQGHGLIQRCGSEIKGAGGP